ncbi:MAG TPA: hypothetical protein H9963_04485 [Candidatus Flavonifractor avicola]|nr:hypothetical protein [Candidatus Flavonifractor avicola]
MADVIRVQRSIGYTVLPNGILRDTGLSLKTKGLFAIILSLPEDWDYSVAGLATVAGCGRDAIRSALGEMETAGYLRRTRSHGEDGKFAGVIYDIRDVAAPLSENPTMEEDAPLSGKPTSAEPTLEKPSSENPTQLNKDISNKDLINPHSPPPGDKPQRKKRRPKSAPTWHPERFEGFWRAYPRDEDRAKAVEQWDKLPEDQALVKRYGSEEALLHDIAVGLKRHLDCEDWREGRGIPYAFRWLRDRRWTEKRKIVQTQHQPPPQRVVERDGVPVW